MPVIQRSAPPVLIRPLIMNRPLLSLVVAFVTGAAGLAAEKKKPAKPAKPDAAPAAGGVVGWLDWRGPFQTGVSLEKGLPDKIDAKQALWTADFPGHSAPVIANGKLYIMGFEGEGGVGCGGWQPARSAMAVEAAIIAMRQRIVSHRLSMMGMLSNDPEFAVAVRAEVGRGPLLTRRATNEG